MLKIYIQFFQEALKKADKMAMQIIKLPIS